MLLIKNGKNVKRVYQKSNLTDESKIHQALNRRLPLYITALLILFSCNYSIEFLSAIKFTKSKSTICDLSET